MKVISIWQPFASLLVGGYKVFETRTWPAPASILGKTIGIASTKGIKPAQRAYFEDVWFNVCYDTSGLPPFEELPCGYLLGTVTVDSVELMTEEFMDEVSRGEQAFGFWEVGNYAWRMTNPIKLAEPIPIRGSQGIYEWNGTLPDEHQAKISEASTEKILEDEPPMDSPSEVKSYRGGLRLVKW